MPKSISRRKLIQNFKKLGFEGSYIEGRHFFMKKDDLKVRIPNNHPGDIGAGLVSEILRQAGISPKDWELV